jgi:hypothetical protein
MTTPTPKYEPNIPQEESTVGNNQVPFLNNFNQLFLAFGNDHIALNDPTNAGNHSVIKLAEQGNTDDEIPSDPATNIGEIAFYSLKPTDQTDQIFFRQQNNADPVQYTNYQIYPLAPIMQGSVVVQRPFFSFLPGNIIVYFGTFTPNANPFDLIIEPVVSTNIYGVNLGVLNTPSTFVSNVAPLLNASGKCNIVRTTRSVSTIAAPPQSYIIFGNVA